MVLQNVLVIKYQRTAAGLNWALNYGNENLGSYKSYWMEDSLKISNTEQVIVFKNMMEQNNHFSKKAKNQLSLIID